jgi:hypothetical protein
VIDNLIIGVRLSKHQLIAWAGHNQQYPIL